MEVVTEKEIPGAEKGWYVVDADRRVISGPFNFLWQANAYLKSL